MSQLPRYKNVTDAIAEDRWAYVSTSGKLKTSRIVVGRPRPWPGNEKGDWVCPVFIEHVTPGVQAIAGVGPVDALMNAIGAVKAFSDEICDFVPRAAVPPASVPRSTRRRPSKSKRHSRR